MQVSGADSQAPFVPTQFFAEALKDENTSRAQHAQSENHSREVDSHHAEGQEDIVNIQGNPDAVHGTAGTNHLEQDQTGEAKSQSSRESSGQGEKNQQSAEETRQAEQKARFFDRSGQLAEPQASSSVVDVFG
ncbi:MAG: hypothetical protein ACE5IY_05915 [bacterium]